MLSPFYSVHSTVSHFSTSFFPHTIKYDVLFLYFTTLWCRLFIKRFFFFITVPSYHWDVVTFQMHSIHIFFVLPGYIVSHLYNKKKACVYNVQLCTMFMLLCVQTSSWNNVQNEKCMNFREKRMMHGVILLFGGCPAYFRSVYLLLLLCVYF